MNESILIIPAIIWIAIIVVYIFLLVCVSANAKRFGRDEGGYVLMGIFFSPLVPFICLTMLGETDKHRKARIIEEEEWRRSCLENGVKESVV